MITIQQAREIDPDFSEETLAMANASATKLGLTDEDTLTGIRNGKEYRDLFDSFSMVMIIAYYSWATGRCTYEEAVRMAHLSHGLFEEYMTTLNRLADKLIDFERESALIWGHTLVEDYVI